METMEGTDKVIHVLNNENIYHSVICRVLGCFDLLNLKADKSYGNILIQNLSFIASNQAFELHAQPQIKSGMKSHTISPILIH